MTLKKSDLENRLGYRAVLCMYGMLYYPSIIMGAKTFTGTSMILVDTVLNQRDGFSNFFKSHGTVSLVTDLLYNIIII